MWLKIGKSKRLASPWEENFKPIKRTIILIKIYLEEFRISIKQLIFLQLHSGIYLTKHQLSLYKLHERQLKIKTKNKNKMKQNVSLKV